MLFTKQHFGFKISVCKKNYDELLLQNSVLSFKNAFLSSQIT